MGITTKSDIALVALKANTASLALTASYFSGSISNATSASYAETASYFSGSISNATSASYAETASYFSGSITNATFANTASVALSSSVTNTQEAGGFPLTFVRNNTNPSQLLTDSSSLQYNPAIGILYTTSSRAISSSRADIANRINIASDDAGSGNYEILLAEVTGVSVDVKYDSSFTFNPSTNRLSATNISSTSITGSSLTGSFTGSLLGTASWANNVISASFASTASYFSGSINNATSASYAVTAGLAQRIEVTDLSGAAGAYEILFVDSSGSQIAYAELGNFYYVPASDILYVDNIQVSQSLTARGVSLTGSFSGSLIGTASWANNVISASFATSASQAVNAQTASFLSVGTYNITASWAQSASQAVSSSFATNAANVGITNLTSSGGGPFYPMFTATNNGNGLALVDTNLYQYTPTTNTLTVTSSYAVQASQSLSSSYADTASFLNPGTYLITASWAQSASQAISASRAVSSSLALTANTASYVLNAVSSSFAISASNAINAQTASFLPVGTYNITSSWAVSASQVISASYAESASFALTSSISLATTENRILAMNKSGATITKGMVVHLTGSNNSSDTPYIITASYENDTLSANTLGIAYQTITTNNTGYVVTEGVLTGIDVTGFTSGQVIYLGSTGSITGSAPLAPLHSVRLGQVVRDSPSNNGAIYVRVDNGYELGELHDIRDFTTTSSYGDLLVKSGSVWINSKQLTGSYGLTGSLQATSFTGSLLGTASFAISASRAAQADNTSTIDINVFGSPVDSYLLMSNVAGTTGVAIGGDADLRYNSSTNVLTVPNISATSLTGSLSGSLIGTASWANNVISSSFASTASYVLNSVSSSFASTASFAPNYVLTSATASMLSPYVLTSQTSSMSVATASLALRASGSLTGSLLGTASWANNAISASFLPVGTYNITSSWAVSASQAITASYVLNTISSSFASTASFAPNYVLNSQTSSFVTNAQTSSFVLNSQTSSMSVATASLALRASGSLTGSFTGSLTGSLLGTASFATSASQAVTASYVLNAVSSSFASTASYSNTLGAALSNQSDGTLRLVNSANTTISSVLLTASLANTASFVNTLRQNVIISGSLLVSSSILGSGSFYNTTIDLISSAVSTNNNTGSITFGTKYLIDNNNIRSVRWNERYLTDSSQSISVNWGSRTLVSGSTNVLDWSSGTGSLIGTSSWATRAISASFLPVGTYNITSSWAVSASQAISASRATTSSFAISASWAPSVASNPFPYTGSAIISGSLTITGSLQVGVPGTNTAAIDTTVGTLSRGGVTSVDWVNRLLFNSTAVNSADWENASLNDTAGLNSVLWGSRQLLNSSETTILDWENLALYDNATFPSMDWNARYLYDSAGNRSQNYDARALIYPNGTSVALSYGTQDQVTISGSTLITGSLTVGSSSLGPSENTITLGPRDTTSEGGQIGFNAPGGTYTSASMIDLYQNRLRILKGTNAGSTAEVAWWSMNNLQMALPAYTGSGAFPGTETAMLGVDTSGNVLTTTIAGSTVFGNFAGTGFTHPIVTYLPFGTTTVSGAEAQRQIASPFAGTIKNLYIRTNNTAPATSYTTWTVRINGVATGITLIISGGQAAAKYFNTTNSASVAIGDEISLQVSTSVANGPQVNQYSFGIYPS